MKNEDKSDIFHSSTYGRSQNGGSMGSASTESFATRRNLDGSRQFVRGYGDSKVAGSAFASGPRPAQYVKPAANTGAQPASRPAPQRPPMPRNPGIHLK